jgi:hypothetical protein
MRYPSNPSAAHAQAAPSPLLEELVTVLQPLRQGRTRPESNPKLTREYQAGQHDTAIRKHLASVRSLALCDDLH